LNTPNPHALPRTAINKINQFKIVVHLFYVHTDTRGCPSPMAVVEGPDGLVDFIPAAWVQFKEMTHTEFRTP
jgi:hypothetical protein